MKIIAKQGYGYLVKVSQKELANILGEYDLSSSEVAKFPTYNQIDQAITKETDLEICNKVKAAHQSGLNVILCIGETKEEKDKGLTLSVLKNQIDNSLNCDFNAENTVIAYEPVWAIGTSLTPTIEEIQSTHLAIRKHIDSKNQNTANNIKILYGGSLKASNAKDILSLTDVDGGLIGGASLIASEFLSIINS